MTNNDGTPAEEGSATMAVGARSALAVGTRVTMWVHNRYGVLTDVGSGVIEDRGMDSDGGPSWRVVFDDGDVLWVDTLDLLPEAVSA